MSLREKNRTALKELNKIKNELSPFKIGEEVKCQWGSGLYDQVGVVVDPLVNYNNCMKFTEEYCEPACVVRLYNTTLPTGYQADTNCVIPHRQIQKMETA